MELPDAVDLEAVAIPVCPFDLETLANERSGMLSVLARGDCVSCAYAFCGAPNDPPPMSPAGWALVGSSASAEGAVKLVRCNLTRGAVMSVTRTPAVFKDHPTIYGAMPVWLVHVDPTAWIEHPLRSDAHLSAPFELVVDPTADLPLFGPVRRHRLLPPLGTNQGKGQAFDGTPRRASTGRPHR
jgi:hypothetical protein